MSDAPIRMTVGDLRKILESYQDDKVIVFRVDVEQIAKCEVEPPEIFHADSCGLLIFEFPSV